MKKLVYLLAFGVSTISFAQNVGINTDGSDPDTDALLHLLNTNSTALDPLIRLENQQNASVNGIQLLNSGGATAAEWDLYIPSSTTDFRVSNGTTDHVTIKNDGDVGIGTTSPGAPLHVHGNGVADNGNLFRVTTTDGRNMDIRAPNAGDPASPFIFQTGNAWKFEVDGVNAFQIGSHGLITFNEDGGLIDFRVEGDTDPNLLFVDGSEDRVGIGTSSPTAKLDVDGSAIFNESGAAVDFRVESDGQTHMFYVDGTNNEVGIGTSSPGAPLHVYGNGVADNGNLFRVTTTDGRNMDIRAPNAGDPASPFIFQTGNAWKFEVDGVNAFQIGKTGDIVFNEDGELTDFRVEGDTEANLLFVDGTADRVGIGTSSPGDKLSVDGGITCYQKLTIDRTSVSDGAIRNWILDNSVATSGGGLIANSLQFKYQSGATATSFMTLTSGGLLGIGTTSPTEKLHVVGNILASGTITPSDRRYKKDITPISNALGLITQFNGYNYNYRTEEFPEQHFDSTAQVGFIAQELKEVLPQVVSEGSTGYLAVDYAKVTPLLLMAIKEQQAIIESQKAEIESLKAEASNATSSSEENASEIEKLKAQLNALLQAQTATVSVQK